MLKRSLQKIKDIHLIAGREQKGQSIIIFTFAFLGLIAMMGLALDLGLVYIEQVRVGSTSDASTLASVVELPAEEEAIKRAIEFIELNGFSTGAGGDTRILVRGCVQDLQVVGMSGSETEPLLVNENGIGAAAEHVEDEVITPPTTVIGAPLVNNPTEYRATFMIDTYSYHDTSTVDGGCNATGTGSAQKIQIRGQSEVRMNFMQFFGFAEVPVEAVAEGENITSLDVVVVFDVSGSMEYETNCFDCWVRTNPDNPEYPLNGYFNPLPYNTKWISGTGTTNSIPTSNLCRVAPSSSSVHTDSDGNKYLSHEAELYSRNQGDWRLSRHLQGSGFWAVQRGSRNTDNLLVPHENGYTQGNQAGNIDNQSSNVCHPGTASSTITCQIGGDDICEDSDGGISVDCSAYIKSHPFPTYSQGAGGDPKLQGGTFNLECFTDDKCWKNVLTGNDVGRPVKNDIPFVEYDFYPQWSGPTQVWMRVRGGGTLADTWAGLAPDTDGGSQDPWGNAIMWEAFRNLDSTSTVAGIQLNTSASTVNTSRDTRATSIDGDTNNWQWIKLGNISTNSLGGLYTLRLFQASAGYKIDKIVFTDATSDSEARAFVESSTWDGKGPPATDGSATRESCNFCNPAFGLTVNQEQCGCPQNAIQAADYASRYPGSVRSQTYWAGNSGSNCTVVGGTVADPTNNLNDDLFSGLEPLRSAQEAIKEFARRLDPEIDQIGFVAFTEEVKKTTTSGKLLTVPLQCKRANPGDCTPDNPYPLFMETVERQWPQGPTNIADGLKQGLKLLGIDGYGAAACSSTNPDAACDRNGARKVIILLTDGSPNREPSSDVCDNNNLWNGDVAAGDDDYDCSIYYAREAANNGVIVYSIGLGAGVNPDFLTAIAEGVDPHSITKSGSEFLFTARGGQFYNASTPDELDGIFTQILGNIYVRIR